MKKKFLLFLLVTFYLPSILAKNNNFTMLTSFQKIIQELKKRHAKKILTGAAVISGVSTATLGTSLWIYYWHKSQTNMPNTKNNSSFSGSINKDINQSESHSNIQGVSQLIDAEEFYKSQQNISSDSLTELQNQLKNTDINLTQLEPTSEEYAQLSCNNEQDNLETNTEKNIPPKSLPNETQNNSKDSIPAQTNTPPKKSTLKKIVKKITPQRIKKKN